MSKYYGNIVEDATIIIPFNTSNAAGASVTVTDLATTDVEVYIDGVIAGDPDAGVSLSIDVDGETGAHLLTIDTSAHAQYVPGSDYQVKLVGITVDAQTINAFIGSFSIENRYMRGTDSAALASVLGAAVGADISADIAAIPTVMVGTDNAALAATALTTAMWTDARAGFLDELAAANLPTDIANVQTEVDKVGTIPALDGAAQTIGAAIAKLADDNGGASFDAELHSLMELRDRGDAAWITGPSAAVIVAALMADAGFTAGGTMTFEELCKILAAWAAGTWRDKPTDSTKQELLDADDDATIILTQTLSCTTPYKEVDIT